MAVWAELHSSIIVLEEGDELQNMAAIWNHILRFITPMSLKCAVELGIPDSIHAHGGAATLPQVAAALSICPDKLPELRRLLRLLVHYGIFAKPGADADVEAYALTPLSKLLAKSNRTGASHLIAMQLDPVLQHPWHVMSAWFRSPEPTPAFAAHHGNGIFDLEVVKDRPEWAAAFNGGLAGDSRLVGEALVKEHPKVFDGVLSMVEVGGRSGYLAAAVAEAFPHMKCIVLDLPHVAVEAAAAVGLGKPSNLEYIGGDMFLHVPSADLILLKWVLMTWSDSECVKILKRCKEALAASKENGGKVVIIEMVMEEDDESRETQLLMDMLMMVARGGMQRDEREWISVFKEAGFSNYTFTPFGVLRSLIELYPSRRLQILSNLKQLISCAAKLI